MNAERPALREFTSMSIVALQQLDLAVLGLRYCA
jgi:hypothetical protein